MMQFSSQDILKIITARIFKLDQLKDDLVNITKKNHCVKLLPF